MSLFLTLGIIDTKIRPYTESDKKRIG
ncbi:hypothetical protein MTR67_018738 [Solanum verrucosum]|uniref:Uncharacterized protein n=1 Tax=Solanum verrucosum TaxID=315347 RepID=A0AAF0QN43_SOLVR|nr:hypothetical protein MTR67_018738 [Solanum verrucosum]